MNKVFKYLIPVVILIVVGGVLIFKALKINNITCESQFGVCDASILYIVSSIKYKNVFETRSELDKLLKQDKSVLEYSIRFELPYNFKVIVIERKPIVAFVLNKTEFALVDKDGVITEKTQTTALPKIDSSIVLTADQTVYLANLMSRLYNFFGVNSGKVTADGFEVDNIEGKKVIFPLTGDVDVLLGSLTLIISRLPSVPEASTIVTIDLRFKNPVLR